VCKRDRIGACLIAACALGCGPALRPAAAAAGDARRGSDAGVEALDAAAYLGSPIGGMDAAPEAPSLIACNATCPGGPCAVRPGAPLVLATGPAPDHVSALAIGPDSVYYGTIARDILTRGQLRKVPFATGVSSVVVSGAQVAQIHIDADATIYYVADEVQSNAAKLYSVVEGQAPVALVAGDEGIPAFLVRSGTIYYETESPRGGYIWKLKELPQPAEGREVTFMGRPSGLDVGMPDICYWTSGDGPSELAYLDSSSRRGDLIGNPDAGTALTTADDRLAGPILDGDQLYFIHAHAAGDCAGAVMMMPVTGGTPTLVSLGHSGSDVSSFAIDAAYVYWTTPDGGGLVFRAAKGGGMPEVIAEDQASAVAIAVDTTRVYWIAAGPQGDEVRAVAK